MYSFSEPHMTFEKRKEGLIEKAKAEAFRLDLAKDTTSVRHVAYSISAIPSDHRGEIDSIYVDEEYRI